MVPLRNQSINLGRQGVLEEAEETAVVKRLEEVGRVGRQSNQDDVEGEGADEDAIRVVDGAVVHEQVGEPPHPVLQVEGLRVRKERKKRGTDLSKGSISNHEEVGREETRLGAHIHPMQRPSTRAEVLLLLLCPAKLLPLLIFEANDNENTDAGGADECELAADGPLSRLTFRTKKRGKGIGPFVHPPDHESACSREPF